MDIIVVQLSRYLELLSQIAVKLGYQVYYLKLTGDADTVAENMRAERLKSRGILPLPFADLSHFQGISEYDCDIEKKTLILSEELAPDTILEAFLPLYPGIVQVKKKLRIAIQSALVSQMMYVTGKVNIWSKAHPDRKILLIDSSYHGLLAPKMPANVHSLILPSFIFTSVYQGIRGGFEWGKNTLVTFHKKKKDTGVTTAPVSSPLRFPVAMVTHAGLNYGNLFEKNLYYSSRKNSRLNPSNLLYFDYCDYPCPSKNLNWIHLGSHRQSLKTNMISALQATRKGIFKIRRLQHLLGLVLLIHQYIIYRSFYRKLEKYPDLTIALIDYEILCPKELLLAFEGRGITTLATQERFISTFNYLFSSIMVSRYFCVSPFVANRLNQSPINCIEFCTPVGQYRSDYLLSMKNSPPPEILTEAIAKGFHIITALGFHTHLQWQNSQVDPLLNWKAHKQFLEDMIRLSRDVPRVFIVLRYKDVNWCTIPFFSDIIGEIKSSENIVISEDYEKYLVSYDLCAHSDLVIAKHTSLGDECLSVGIPVLFHEYTHNTHRLIADGFDYQPTRIMCFNYQELLERTNIVLSGTPHDMTKDYEYLKTVVFGGMGDGNVQARIHAYVDKILTDIESQTNAGTG